MNVHRKPPAQGGFRMSSESIPYTNDPLTEKSANNLA
jgi:hypothetical protein